MGFFDSLFGSKKRTNVEVVPDHIWMTTDAKFAGLSKEVEERSRSETVAILLVAHFPDVLARLSELASQQTGVPVQAVLADNLDTDLAAKSAFGRVGHHRHHRWRTASVAICG